jgi:hypothetical protein
MGDTERASAEGRFLFFQDIVGFPGEGARRDESNRQQGQFLRFSMKGRIIYDYRQ